MGALGGFAPKEVAFMLTMCLNMTCMSMNFAMMAAFCPPPPLPTSPCHCR